MDDELLSSLVLRTGLVDPVDLGRCLAAQRPAEEAGQPKTPLAQLLSPRDLLSGPQPSDRLQDKTTPSAARGGDPPRWRQLGRPGATRPTRTPNANAFPRRSSPSGPGGPGTEGTGAGSLRCCMTSPWRRRMAMLASIVMVKGGRSSKP